ncbi:Potassium voltage-gated channel protein eag [Papilio machaon]|uniref:Potassium voltage-gated channel protein eag n=1 Tax=Papilio machaon TaxID=76193 RepID=A0A194RNP4_PAPMA|nr:Potassium voltage-gated channel protein eag [Papilio machaon]
MTKLTEVKLWVNIALRLRSRGDENEDSSLDVYQYRNETDRQKKFKIAPRIGRLSRIQTDGKEKPTKTYAILQEPRTDYSDLYPVTTAERVTATAAILVGFLLTTIVFVGSLTSQFITITTRRAKYVRQLQKIQNHLKLIKMDEITTKRIIRYYEDLWYEKSGVFKPKLLKLLPFPLQMEICYDLNAVPLYSSLIFRKLPEAFLRRLSVRMGHRFYLPGDIIYNHNENKTVMVCVTSGVLELLSDEDDESPMISFSKGTCFGEIALILNIPARCTVKAATYVECQILRKTEFTKLMITYPDLIGEIRKDILKRIARSRVRKENQTGDDQFLLNIYVSKDRKKSSIKCLKDKLRYRQGKTEVNLTKDDELDENCLDLYIISDHIKKRTTSFTCLNSKFPWILESECYLARYWELYMLLIAKYCTFVSLLCYWCGVILYMESCFVARCSQNSWFARAITENIKKPVAIQMRATKTQFPLVTSIYFSTTLLLSVGYGDFSPGDKHDMGLVAFLSLFGVLLTGYCISEFSSVVTHWSRTKTAFLEVIITIDKFMKENNMHRAIKSRIMAFYELQWQYNSGVELTDQSWLDTTVVPSELRRKVLHQARFKALTSIKFFQVKNKAYIQTLTGMARDVILPPGEIVYYGGTIPRELYIIERGYCLVTSKAMREAKKERVVGPGNHLGLLVMLYGVPAVNTVVTLTHCKLISISHVAYTSALNLFPDMREHDGLLTPEELKMIADQAKLQSAEAYFQHYNVSEKAPKMKITSFLQDFLDNSFINVYNDYKRKNQSYFKSFNQFTILSKLTPYLLMPIAIKPDGIFLKTWAIIRISSAFIMSLLIPIIVSMAPLYGNYNTSLLVFETIAYVDLYLMLHVAFYGAKNQLIYHPYLTAKNYITNAFVVDFLTCFPWYALWKIFVPRHNENHTEEEHYINNHLYHCILRMINVLQIHKLYAAFWTESIGALKRVSSWLDEAKTFKVKNLTPAKAYLLAYYWSATSFSGAGFGDIIAQDTTHMVLSICVIVHGFLFFGYVYARMASLKAMADQMVTNFQENVKHLELFLNREKVAFTLKRTVIDYWKYQWKRTGGWSHQTILGKLHSNLNEDAVLYMYEKTLREIPLFENVEYSFFRSFAKQLQEQYYQKGYMVIRANEVITSMYIIYRGKVDIISESNEVEACMGSGGIFGNIRGASRYLTQSNVVASRNIDLLSIPGTEFYTILKGYPSVLRKVKESFSSTTKDYVLSTIMSERTSVEIQPFSLTYESGEEEDNDVNIYSDSPEKSITESHGSRSFSSIGNTEYIAAKWLLFKPHRWFRSSVVPDSKFVTFMDYFIMCLSYVDFMILVYQMAFMSNAYFLYICIVFDIIFIYKIFLDMHTGYTNRYGDYILNPKKVRKMYFSKTFLRRRDFLSILPVCYLAFAMQLNPNIQNALFCYLRTPQLFRITYLFTYRQHRKINIGSANLFLKLNTIVIWASILSHVNACLFFKLSCLTPVHCKSANWMSKEELNLRAQYAEGKYFSLYITALWYMINLLTITGTGDVSSQNDFEVIETIIVIIIIKFCTGLLISEMSAMITAHSSSRIAYDYQINELKDGLRDTDLSDHQMNKMWDYVCELWNRQQGRQMPELVYKLPFRLRCQVMQAVYGSHIRESVIFGKTDEDFKRMLVMWMKHCVFFPGNYIVQRGDSDQCIYFIHRGEVEVLTVHPNLTESIYDVLGPEDSFGIAQASGLFVGVQHFFSFRARTVVDIVYLKLDEWKYLLDFYPKSAKLVEVLTVHPNLTESIYDVLGPEDSFGIAQASVTDGFRCF